MAEQVNQFNVELEYFITIEGYGKRTRIELGKLKGDEAIKEFTECFKQILTTMHETVISLSYVGECCENEHVVYSVNISMPMNVEYNKHSESALSKLFGGKI